jgi:hypothetical protein
MSQTKSQLIEGSAASELTAAKTLLGAGSAGAPSLTATGDTNTGIFFPTADTIAFAEGGVETVRIDSSGRVGIGTTSANTSIDVRTISTTAYSASNLSAYTGAYISNDGTGGFANITLNAADATGNSNCITAISAISESSGTRNSALAFATRTHSTGNIVERARIDSSGRLLVGTSSSRGGWWNTTGIDSAVQVEATNQWCFSAVNNSANTNGPWINIGKSRGATVGSTTVVQSSDQLGGISFQGADGSELVTAAAIQAFVDGTPGANDMPGRLTFSTTADGASSPTERIRLSNAGLSSFYGTLGVIYSRSGTSAGTAERVFIGYHSASSIVTGTISINIFTNGNINNTNNSYTGISDIKLKENIVDASSQWNDLKSLQVRKYNFKEETGHQTHTQLGLIAQEVEEVSPGLVGESPDLDAEGNDLGTVTKSVNYSVLYMKAVKALQEAMERIETLEGMVAVNNITIDEQQHQISALAARLTALESA